MLGGFNCVLIQELGHWFNHLAPVFHTENKEWIEWPEDAIESCKKYPSYHEVWAQLSCWLYGQDKDSGVFAAFEALEKKAVIFIQCLAEIGFLGPKYVRKERFVKILFQGDRFGV